MSNQKPRWKGYPSEIEKGDNIRCYRTGNKLSILESPRLDQITLKVDSVSYFGGYYDVIVINEHGNKEEINHCRDLLIAFGDYFPSRDIVKIAEKIKRLNIK